MRSLTPGDGRWNPDLPHHRAHGHAHPRLSGTVPTGRRTVSGGSVHGLHASARRAVRGAGIGRQMNDDLEKIQALHALDEGAAKAQDRVALNELVTDDVVFLPPGENPIRGKRQPESTDPAVEILVYRFDWEEVKLLGAYAYEWGRLLGKVKDPDTGKIKENRFNVMRILKRDENGEWKVHRAMWNEAPDESS